MNKYYKIGDGAFEMIDSEQMENCLGYTIKCRSAVTHTASSVNGRFPTLLHKFKDEFYFSVNYKDYSTRKEITKEEYVNLITTVTPFVCEGMVKKELALLDQSKPGVFDMDKREVLARDTYYLYLGEQSFKSVMDNMRARFES